MDDLKDCPDCGSKPSIGVLKTVHGLSSGIIIECRNIKCQMQQPFKVPRYAYNEVQWNEIPTHQRS